MTTAGEPARYLPPELADHLRGIIGGVPDRGARAAIVEFAEMAFQRGNSAGYDRGYLDGATEQGLQHPAPVAAEPAWAALGPEPSSQPSPGPRP